MCTYLHKGSPTSTARAGSSARAASARSTRRRAQNIKLISKRIIKIDVERMNDHVVSITYTSNEANKKQH